MKNEDSNTRDAALRGVLKEWKVEAPLPPRFQEQVWRRIERMVSARNPSVSLAGVIRHWIATMLPRPALATAYLTLLLAIGAGIGWSQAGQETSRVTNELGARYARTIDPYQMTFKP